MAITKSEFNRYRAVQFGGRYNMTTEEAMAEAHLSRDKYLEICKNYSELLVHFGPFNHRTGGSRKERR